MRNKKFSLAELAEAMTVVSLEEQKLYYIMAAMMTKTAYGDVWRI